MGEVRKIDRFDRAIERSWERWAGLSELQRLAAAVGSAGFQLYRKDHPIVDPEFRLPMRRKTQH